MEPFDQSARAAGVVSVTSVADAGLIGVDGNQVAGLCARHFTTSKLSISSR